MKKIIIIIGLFAFAGCSAQPVTPADSQNSHKDKQCDSERGYCINFGTFMKGRTWTNDWTDLAGKPTDHTLSNGLEPEDISYIRADIASKSSPCSPSLTGVSKPTEIPGTNGKTIWGKADISESSREEGWEYEEWKDIVCTYEGTPRPTSVYSMCSEKSGKTVVICINQMTDNEPLAKQIFETFRWTK